MLSSIVVASNSVRALATTDGYLTSEPQLYVSAYQRSDDGLSLKFVQLYNNSSAPIDVSQWGLYVGDVKPENKLDFASSRSGWLEPNTHVIASLQGIVDGATYTFASSPLVTTTPDKATMMLVPPAGMGLRSVNYDLKFTKLSTTKNAYYEIWQRNQTTTGYSSTTTSFTALPAAMTEPHYASGVSLFDNGLYTVPAAPAMHIVEIYPYASDCDPFDTSVLCGDYVKIKVNDPTADLSQYVLRSDSNSSSRTSSNTFALDSTTPNAEGYITLYLTDAKGRISLTNSGGYIWLEDRYGLVNYRETMTRYAGAGSSQQGWSYALGGDGTWQWTSTPQPLADNVITVPVVAPEVKSCPAGQYRSPETNRCRAIEEAVNALATCPEGQYRNPDTNRCKSVTATATASLVPCGEGQERNPATNRCRSIASAVAELIPCDEGYERNPATNRCRKVLGTSTVAPSLVQPAQASPATAASLLTNPYAIGAVVALGGVGYALYEWRSEISSGLKKLTSKLGKK